KCKPPRLLISPGPPPSFTGLNDRHLFNSSHWEMRLVSMEEDRVRVGGKQAVETEERKGRKKVRMGVCYPIIRHDLPISYILSQQEHNDRKDANEDDNRGDDGPD
ncbi:hypothetical protein KUCAC02_029976, partial [Chaenocephalus aceratus]